MISSIYILFLLSQKSTPLQDTKGEQWKGKKDSRRKRIRLSGLSGHLWGRKVHTSTRLLIFVLWDRHELRWCEQRIFCPPHEVFSGLRMISFFISMISRQSLLTLIEYSRGTCATALTQRFPGNESREGKSLSATRHWRNEISWHLVQVQACGAKKSGIEMKCTPPSTDLFCLHKSPEDILTAVWSAWMAGEK